MFARTTEVRGSGVSRGGLVLAALVALWYGTLGPVCGATGGGQTTTTTYTTSITSGITYTRKDLPPATQIIGRLDGGSIVYDQTFVLPLSDPTVQAAVAAANAAITAALSPQSATITGPTFLNSLTAYLGQEVDHTEQSVTTTAAFGPTSILIGDEQSQTFFVAAGTVNYNTNTHTQTFMNDLYRTTDSYELLGQAQAPAAIPTLSEWAQIGMADLLVGGGLLAIRRTRHPVIPGE